MHYKLIVRVLGLLLLTFSVALFPPLVVSVLYGDGEVVHLGVTMIVFLCVGGFFWLPYRRTRQSIQRRDGFVIVAMFWTVLGLITASPFVFGLHLDIADAVFESVSAFTTTGATVIVGLDNLPPSLLFYRQELQWLGGIGVMVSALAVIPLLGIGGMQLYRAEAPGPVKDDKLTPRLQETARSLWRIYGGLTGACALAYWVAGMNWFDAVAHAFSTISTGGFSTHDASLGYYDSIAVEIVAEVFMFLGGVNFALHYLAIHRGNMRDYWHNSEFRVFTAIVCTLIVIVTVFLAMTRQYPDILASLRYGAFQVISVITSTGFTTTDFSIWPVFLPALLIYSSFIGGCAGSTAGGMKVIRIMLLAKQARRDMIHLIHPQLVKPLKIGDRTVQERVVDAVWGFFALYVLVFAVLMLLLMATGVDHVTAFSAIASCINNLGPGLGEVFANFTPLSDFSIWVCSLAMLLGRLELFTILVLLAPGFWKDW